MASLVSRKSRLSSPREQLQILESIRPELPRFASKLSESSLLPLQPTQIEILQINVGKMCNQTCHHCHVDAGPDRREIMTKELMQSCVDAVRKFKIPTVDLTGGAPEMNPNFRWLVQELKDCGAHIINRCNLTIIVANEKYSDLPLFFKQNQIEIVSSLPHFSKNRTDRQRGDGVFEKSIKALRILNEVGYGKEGTGLKLNLVHNPAGCFLPGDQSGLEREFKKQLLNEYGIEFNHLYCITNMPISRYLEYLLESGNFESYMNTLVKNYNSAAARGVMCRNTISVGWDGLLYDCDFNQMLDLKLQSKLEPHIRNFDRKSLEERNIVVGQHCYGCTAGSGSSCGGTVA